MSNEERLNVLCSEVEEPTKEISREIQELSEALSLSQ
jgi:hypothetical protein